MLRSPHDSMDSLKPYFDALYRERVPVIDARSSFVRIERAGSIKRITARVGNQDGRGGNSTYAIKDLLKAEGYRWNTTGWKAWCRTCPAQSFSVQEFLAKAMWISRADGIELRFYDDLEKHAGDLSY